MRGSIERRIIDDVTGKREPGQQVCGKGKKLCRSHSQPGFPFQQQQRGAGQHEAKRREMRREARARIDRASKLVLQQQSLKAQIPAEDMRAQRCRPYQQHHRRKHAAGPFAESPFGAGLRSGQQKHRNSAQREGKRRQGHHLRPLPADVGDRPLVQRPAGQEEQADRGCCDRRGPGHPRQGIFHLTRRGIDFMLQSLPISAKMGGEMAKTETEGD